MLAHPRRSTVRGDGPPASPVPELTARNRPLVVGASIGTRSGLFGSIGAFARRAGRPGFITSPAALGAFGRDVLDESVFQPGAAGGVGLSERTRVGAVSAFVSEINRDQPACYGAFVEVFDQVPVDIDLPVTVGAWRAFTGVAEPAAAIIGSPVAKLGCRTGLTFGVIMGTDATVQIQIGERGQSVLVAGLLEIGGKLASFSLPGDAGAAVFDPVTGAILGLIVAGTEGDAPRTYAVPVSPILERLEAELILL